MTDSDDDPLAALALRIADSRPVCDRCDEPIKGRMHISIEGNGSMWWAHCDACYRSIHQDEAAQEEPAP